MYFDLIKNYDENTELDIETFINDYLQDWHTLAIALKRSDLCTALNWNKSYNIVKELKYVVNNDDLNGLQYILTLKKQAYCRNQHEFYLLTKTIVSNLNIDKTKIIQGLLEQSDLLTQFVTECIDGDSFGEDYVILLSANAFKIYCGLVKECAYVFGLQRQLKHYTCFLEAVWATRI
jgi:hypothetical protein